MRLKLFFKILKYYNYFFRLIFFWISFHFFRNFCLIILLTNDFSLNLIYLTIKKNNSKSLFHYEDQFKNNDFK